MNVDFMRAVDRWAGIPLTLMLTGILKAGSLFGNREPARPQRILFIELSEMGSTILADPSIKKAAKELEAETFFVIFKKNRPSLDLIGTIRPENTYTLREDNLVSLALDTFRFLIWTRQKNIDTVIDLELFSRFTALLSGLCGASNRVGFYSFHNEGLYRGNMLTHRVAYNPHIHIAKNFIALVNSVLSGDAEVPFSKKVVTDSEIALPVMTYPQAELDRMHGLVKKHCPGYDRNSQRLILVNPNASELLPQRRWMPERYVELMQRILVGSPDVLVLITGAPSEHEEAGAMQQMVGSERCINFAGTLELGQLPVLYSISVLMVTNDSGPGHFSSITELPTFVLFGPETPKLYGSLGNSTPIYAGLACSPCVSASNHRKTPCQDNKCLQAISVEQVYDSVKSVLLSENDGA